MHDPKSFNNEEVQRFEKEVQQKMEGLEFRPSEAVWANVSQAVNGNKKRRRAPLFWLYFLSAFLLVGAAGVYFIGGHPSSSGTADPTINNRPVNNQPAGTDQQPGNSQLNKIDQQAKNDQGTNGRQSNDQQPDRQPNAQSAANDRSTAVNQSAKNNQSPTITSPASENESAKPSAEDRSATPPAEDRFAKSSAQNGTGLAKSTAGKKSVSIADKRFTGKGKSRDKLAKSSKSTAAGDNTTTADNTVTPDRTGTAGANTRSGSEVTGDQQSTGDQPSIGKISRISLIPISGRNSPKITAAPLVSKSQALTKTRLNPKHPWEAGFSGGIGVSSLNQAFLKRSTVAAAYNNRNSMAAITGQPQINISKIQPDLSFWAGIFMQKQLLKNISVSFGLNLHYYSTRISTGDKVELNNYSLSLPPAGLYTSQTISSFAAAPAAAPRSYPYYTAGDKQTFINRYYFLELPGSIQWQISRRRVLPLFWEAGFSLSYLMSSNALYYEPKAAVYYKDANVTNKLQFHLSTALMVGLPFKGINLQAGPQVQYGLTSLLNTENNGQHLFYGGLKFVIIPEKSHKAGGHRFSGQ